MAPINATPFPLPFPLVLPVTRRAIERTFIFVAVMEAVAFRRPMRHIHRAFFVVFVCVCVFVFLREWFPFLGRCGQPPIEAFPLVLIHCHSLSRRLWMPLHSVAPCGLSIVQGSCDSPFPTVM